MKGRDELSRATLSWRGGLQNDRATSRERRGDTTNGNGHGEIPRGGNDSDIDGHESRPRHVGLIGELQRRIRIVVTEVDRFAHLGVGLIDGFSCLGSSDLDQLAPARCEDVADAMQRGSPLLRGARLPGVSSAAGGLDKRIDGLVRGQRLHSGTHSLHTPRRGRNRRGDVARPLAVCCQSGIRICLGYERAMRALSQAPLLWRHPGLALRQTVLAAVRSGNGRIRIDVGQCGEEAVAFAGEDILVCGNIEDPGHKVLGRRVFLKAAHQVGDGDVELTGVDDRDVQEERTDVAAHDLLDAGCHAREHLKLDAVLDAARSAQLVGESNVEDVLSGHSQSDRSRPFRSHRPAEHALVIRICGLLGGPGCQLPPVNFRVHLLHGQVRALDDTYLDARAARVHATACPLLEALESAEGIGQIGLEDDAGLVAAHIGLVEDRSEDSNRQVEILVVLHVEIEEGPVVAGEAVERQESTHAVVDDLLEAPGVVRSRHGRHLDGDVVDILAGHEA